MRNPAAWSSIAAGVLILLGVSTMCTTAFLLRRAAVAIISSAAAVLLVLGLGFGVTAGRADASTPAAGVADPHLVGEWHLDSAPSAPDSSGSGNDGEVFGASLVPGKFGQALTFDPVHGSVVRIPGASSLEPAAVTAVAWVRAGSSPGAEKYVMGKGATGCSAASYALYTGADGGLQFYIYDGAHVQGSPEIPASAIWDGNWHGVAGVFDGTTVRLYVDGQEVGAGTPVTGRVDYGLPVSELSLGNLGNGQTCDLTSFAYTGAIDEARVYDRALSAAELGYLLTAGGPTPPELPVPSARPSSTAVSCEPSSLAVGRSSTCTATVSDTGSGSPTTPGGTVSFSSDASGSFTPQPASCALTATGTAGVGSCSVIYVPASGGTHTITAAYAGDATHQASSGTTTLDVAAAGGKGGGESQPVPRIVAGASAKLPGGTRLSAFASQPSLGATIVGYRWHFPDNTTDVQCGQGASVVSHTFAHAGEYRVSLTVYDSAGSSATTTESVLARAASARIVSVSRTFFDCENPAAGNQPDRADCVKTIFLGILEIASRGKPEDCFQIAARFPTSVFTGRPGTTVGHLGNRATAAARTRYETYHAEIHGPVALNGLYVPVPEQVKTEYDSRDGTVGLGDIPVRVGSILTTRVPLSLKIRPDKHGEFQLAYAEKAVGAVAKLFGLPIDGGVNIILGKPAKYMSTATLSLGLPKIFDFPDKKGAQGSADLILDNEQGARYDGLQLKVDNAYLGPIYLSGMSFRYSLSQDLWQGGATVRLPGSPFDINVAGPPSQPPDFGFAIKQGRFDHAGIAVDFLPPAQPELFPGLFLTHIGVAIGINPLRFTGTAGVTAANIVDVDGAVYVAFASPDQKYEFPSDAGQELKPLAGRTLDSFTLAIGGSESLHLPAIDAKIDLIHSYLLYESPDYFEMGGTIGFHRSFLSVDGGISGFVYPSHKLFDLEGGVHACLRDINGDPIKIGYSLFSVEISPCLNVGGAVSSTGIGVCGVLPVPFPVIGTLPVPLGIGYKWGDSTPDIMIFSCDYGPYEARSPRAAAATATDSVQLPAGLPAAMIRVRGQGGAPSVAVQGPHGESSGSSKDIVTVTLASSQTTLIGVRHPLAGRWTISANPGSAPIASIETAEGLRNPTIKARVSGSGSRRLLAYRISQAPGMSVTFAERGARTFHVLGRAHARAGQIVFTPDTARSGRRNILALVTENGAPRQAITVATYTATRQRPPAAPRSVRVTHVPGRITVTWAPVPGAARYEVTLQLADGRHEFQIVRGTRSSLPVPRAAGRGVVLVDALTAANLRGRAARASIR